VEGGDRVLDRVVGCVLGLALGDALGAPFEFRRRGEIPDPLPALELPWMGFPPGATTDDTAMAMNLVRSLADRGGFDADDVAARHLAWFETDPPDVGSLTRRVLRRVARSDGSSLGVAERAERAARDVWQERGPEVSAGNGSVMYCAPLGCAYAGRPEALVPIATTLSGLTHHDARCRTAVIAVTSAVAALVRGEQPVSAVAAALRLVADLPGGEELEFLVDAVGSSRSVDGPDQGFVLYAAAVGLQAALQRGSFRDGTRHVVTLGGDTDTNAAVAGALLGARSGAGRLPPDWLGRLRDRREIEHEARRLAAQASMA
jgi:ADP-ribosyl-[dinitrogen reductase] hydrolase